MVDLSKLREPFPIKKISWRVGRKRKDGQAATALAYIDVRDLYDRLDEICSPENWQIRYTHAGSKTIAEIGVFINDGRRDAQWVWKANGAGDTQIEADKGAISDAAKRAGVPWGIGRYLYDVPEIWVDIDQYGKFINPEDPKFEGALKKAEAINRGEKIDYKPEPPKKPVEKITPQEAIADNKDRYEKWLDNVEESRFPTFGTKDEITVWEEANKNTIDKLDYYDLGKRYSGIVSARMAAL